MKKEQMNVLLSLQTKIVKRLLMVCMLVLVSAGIYAQKGKQAVGVNTMGGLLYEEMHGGISLKYQYYSSNRFCIEPSFLVLFGAGDGKSLELDVNTHILLGNSRRVKPYVIVGLGYGNVLDFPYEDDPYYSYDDYEYCTASSLMINGGLGMDCRLSPVWSMQMEVMPTFDYNFGDGVFFRLRFGIGVTYNF